MTRQDEVTSVLLGILRVGLLRIRNLGDSGHSDACSIEADHLHNIPTAIHPYCEDLVRFYLDVERPAFLQAIGAQRHDEYEGLWNRLSSLLSVQ